MPKPSKKSPNFEQSLNELEAIVDKMEQGDLTLEESLAQFEKGVKLSRQCQATLREAEQKVQILLEKNGLQPLQPFDIEDDEEE